MGTATAETLFDHEADYVASDEIAKIAGTLIRRHEIVALSTEDLRIAYMERLGERSGEGEEAIAKCQKASPLWRDLAGYDVVIWAWAEVWEQLESRQREALVLHELLHIGRNRTGGVKLRKHDLEEFAMVVLHYGPWDGPVELFGKALRRYEVGETRQPEGAEPIRLPAGRERRRPGTRGEASE